MQIRVRKLKATNTKGARLKAVSEVGELVIPFPHESSDPFRYAAERMAGGPVEEVTSNGAMSVYKTPEFPEKKFYVIVSVKLDNEWNEWDVIPAFSITRLASTSLAAVARHACMIVDRKGEEHVIVEVLNDSTGYYEPFEFEPIRL